MMNRIHRIAAAGMMFAGATACSGDGGPTGPGTPPEPTSFDLMVDVQRLYVRGDCESADDNPGDFNWQVTLTVPNRQFDKTGSNGQYPSENTVVRYHDGDAVDLGLDLTLADIPADDVDDVVIVFQAIEWDPDGPDPDMNDQGVVNQVLRTHNGGTHFAGIGFSSACALRLQYVPQWTSN